MSTGQKAWADEAACAVIERGLRAKKMVAGFNTYSLGQELMNIDRLLREVEASVMGGAAIDKLRSARRTLADLT